jgi:nucleoside-triphosphatase THEP1
MRIAYTMAPGRGDTDLVLARLADQLLQRGWQTGGVVQINTDRNDGHPCDMDVCVLPKGPVFRISQSLGPMAKGCRLDPSALEQAVCRVAETVANGIDVLIINKFGKHEAEGRGFRSVIADALAQELPVIVGLNALNLNAFLEFTEGAATLVQSDVGVLEAWLGAPKVQASAA